MILVVNLLRKHWIILNVLLVKNCFVDGHVHERRSIKSEQLARDASRLMNRNIQINDFVCRFCHSKISAKISKEKKQQQQLSLSKSEMATSEPSSSTTTTTTTTSTMEKENCLPDDVQQQSSEESSSSSSDESDDNYNDPSYKARISKEEKKYEVPYSRPVATHGYCFICSKTENLKIISIQARLDVFRKRKIFIPAANRCLDHLNNETLLLNENRKLSDVLSNVC